LVLDFFIFFFLFNFIIGLIGFLTVRLNIILWLIALELMLFSSNMVFIFASIFLDDIMGQVYTLIFLLIIAGESAFAFTLLMAIVSLERTTDFNYIKNIKQSIKV
jgi:NADH:ubiquinone oxidoreductase subunit K